MSKNLKPLYIDTETGRLKFNNEQPADGAIVAHLVHLAEGKLTCDMNASEMIDYLQDGTPVFLQVENEGKMITTGNCLASTEAPQEVVFYFETRDRNLKFVIAENGSAGVTDKLLPLRADVYYDGSAYVCDKSFDDISNALKDGVPVDLHLSVDGQQSYLSSLAGTAKDCVYFRVWGPDGWGTVTVYASGSVTVVWDSDEP